MTCPDSRLLYVWLVYLAAISIGIWGVLRLANPYSGPFADAMAITLPVAGFLAGFAYILLRYRSWQVTVREEELLLRRGVFREKTTFVPRNRIQHIDVEARLIERVFGLARIVVYTAGSPHSSVIVPGLDRADASELRERLS